MHECSATSRKGLLSTWQDLLTYKYIKPRRVGYNLCLAQTCCKHSFSKCYLDCAITAGKANAGELFDALLSFDRDPSCSQDSGRNEQWEMSLGLDEAFCSSQEQPKAESLFGSQSPHSLHLSSTRCRVTLTTHPWAIWPIMWIKCHRLKALANTTALTETMCD